MGGDVDPDDPAFGPDQVRQLETVWPAPQPTSTISSPDLGARASMARSPSGES